MSVVRDERVQLHEAAGCMGARRLRTHFLELQQLQLFLASFQLVRDIRLPACGEWR